ncbi:MAG: nucleotidyl transferase AbiEii/AbiGii toxin family protein [bacterium]|jgi:hypothetical protein|nr:nucleotidyl transferase AbiEii/AbiGii toxin family protein [bacterium]
MHEEILTKSQIDLLPLIRIFNRSFYLVGGTAIALYLGHRQSIDFDLFNPKSFNRKSIQTKILENDYHIDKTLIATNEEYTLIANNVKLTFYNFPFDIPHKSRFKNIISLPSLLDLAAMKAYALGRRAKWKDYIDLYFIFKYHYSLTELCNRTTELFNDLFSEKLFRSQLSYFDDIDHSEPVSYAVNPIHDEEIKEFLKNIATQAF